jgi:hypothetical protein
LRSHRIAGIAATGATGVLSGCDPILSIQGAFFPAWILCIAGGLVVTGVVHRVLVASGLQPYVGPLALVYPSIALCATNLLWLLFFRT